MAQEPQSSKSGAPAGALAPLPPTMMSYEEASNTFLNTLYHTEPQQDSTSTQDEPSRDQPGKFGRGLRFIGRVAKAAGKGVLDIATNPIDTGRSAARGAVNAVDAVAETSIAATSWLLRKSGIGQALIDDEYNFIYDQLGAQELAKTGTQFINTAEDFVLGKRSDRGAQQFVESVSQFLVPFAALSKVKAFGALGAVGSAAVRGAITDFAAFDPYEAQLAELAASSNIPGVSDLGRVLSVEEDDNPLVARFKRSASGIIAGSAIDGLVAGARVLRGMKVLRNPAATVAEKKAAQEMVDREAKVLADVDDGTHIPDDPVVVRPTDDGQYRLDINEKLADQRAKFNAQAAEDILPDPLDVAAFERRGGEVIQTGSTTNIRPGDPAATTAKVGTSLDIPTFLRRADAEGQAATINEALAYRFRAAARVPTEKMKEAFTLAKQIEEAKDNPEKIVELVSEARFNFTYMDPPEKVESLLKSVGEVLSPVFDRTQGRPVVGVDESVERAMQLAGMLTREDVPEYAARVTDVAKNLDANLLVLNARVMELGEQVAKWGTILEEHPLDVVAQIEARKALRSYINTAADVAGANSGVGRGLNILKFRNRLSSSDVKFKGEEGAVGAPAKQELAPDIVAGMSTTELKNMTRLFRMSNEPRVLFNTLASEIAPKSAGRLARFGHGMLEYFYNSVLSSPATHAAIFVGNSTVSMMEDAVRLAAGAIRRDPEMIRFATDLIQGRLVYMRQSVKGFAQAFRAGHSIIDPKPVYKAIPGVGGEVVRTFGTRPIAAMDEFWRVNNNLAYVRAQSLRLARREATARGLTGRKLDEFVAGRVQADVAASIDPATGASRLPEAREFAALPTFSSPLESGSFGQSVEKLVREHPWLVPIAPFVRTSVNALDYSFFKSSPLGLLTRSYKEALARGGQDAAIMQTRMALGTTVWGMAGLMAFSGSITGRGPTNPRLREMWLTNHQPYSVGFGDKWISYRRLEPFATMLGATADAAHILRDNADDLAVQEDGSKVIYAIIASSASAMASKTYLSGLVQFMDALGSSNGPSFKRFVDRQVGTLVPNVVAGLNNDPYQRQTQGLLDALRNRVPGWSNDLPARYNVFGEPLLSEPGRIQRNLNPFPIKDAAPSTEDEFLALDRAFVAPPTYERFGNLVVNLHDRKYQNRHGGSLTPYERLMDIVESKNLRGQVDDIISSSAYERAGDGTDVFQGGRRYIKLRDRIDRVYARARRQMLSEYPELKRELTGLNRARRSSQRSDVKGQGLLDLIGR